MNLDIRLPIGLMFAIFGLILTIFGMVGDQKIYERSLGTNINIWWGLCLLFFGICFLFLTWKGKSK